MKQKAVHPIIVTGTGTDVGKTFTLGVLAYQLTQRGYPVTMAKPIQTGEPDGSGDIFSVAAMVNDGAAGSQAAGAPPRDLLTVAEYARFPEPLAPNLSARRAGVRAPGPKEVAAWLRNLGEQAEYNFPDAPSFLLVEGAGGITVRLGDGNTEEPGEWTIVDLARQLDAPMLVVCGTGLGALNEAELTVAHARNNGVKVIGLIGGTLKDHDDLATQLNLEELPVVTQCAFFGAIPTGTKDLSSPDLVTPLLRTLNIETT